MYENKIPGVAIDVRGQRVVVITPWDNGRFKAEANALKGRFFGGTWSFDHEHHLTLLGILDRLYGTDYLNQRRILDGRKPILIPVSD